MEKDWFARMADTPNSKNGILMAAATYEIARTYGDAPLVSKDFIEGVSGCRSGYRFTVHPLEADGSSMRLDNVDAEIDYIRLWKLRVTCEKQAPEADLDPDHAVETTALIARDLRTAFVLRVPKWGFPGETPRRERMNVTIDGHPAKLNYSRHRDPNSVTVIPETDNMASLAELQSAASGENPPRRARMMAAEAAFQAFWNPSASPVTAVVVAASACEVAIHSCIRHLETEQTRPLIKKLVPKGSQAKLSPPVLVDTVIPLLTSRRLADENPRLWGSIKELFKARDIGVHQGILPEGIHAPRMAQVARIFTRWIEELEMECKKV